jgi:hypothetical protein
VWQIGGPCFIAIGDAWMPFTGRTAASPEELRDVTDEMMVRIGVVLDRAGHMAG